MVPDGLAGSGTVRTEDAFILSASALRPYSGGIGPYLSERQTVIAEAKRWKGDRDAADGVIWRAPRLAMLERRAEVRTTGQSRRVPPRRGRIIGDRGEGAGHAPGADPDRIRRLRARGVRPHDEK